MLELTGTHQAFQNIQTPLLYHNGGTHPNLLEKAPVRTFPKPRLSLPAKHFLRKNPKVQNSETLRNK